MKSRNKKDNNQNVKEENDDIFSEEMDNSDKNISKKQTESNEPKENFCQSIFHFEDLTEDDDIFTFQCPQSLSLKDLENMVLGGGSLANGMEVNFINTEKDLTLALPHKQFEGCMIKVPVLGHIVIQKTIETPKENLKDSFSDDDSVKYPKDLKIRHPLLGSDWQAHISSVEEVLKKSNYSVKSKGKVRARNLTSEKFNENEEIRANEEEEEEVPHKKKKKKVKKDN